MEWDYKVILKNIQDMVVTGDDSTVAYTARLMALANRITDRRKAEHRHVEQIYKTEKIYFKRWYWKHKVANIISNSQYAIHQTQQPKKYNKQTSTTYKHIKNHRPRTAPNQEMINKQRSSPDPPTPQPMEKKRNNNHVKIQILKYNQLYNMYPNVSNNNVNKMNHHLIISIYMNLYPINIKQPPSKLTRNKCKRTYSKDPYLNHFQHLISLKKLRSRYPQHRQTYCNCDFQKEKAGHIQILLPHNKNIHKTDLEYKMYEIENILHQIVRERYQHWSRTDIHEFTQNHIKITMFHETDLKYIVVHRK